MGLSGHGNQDVSQEQGAALSMVCLCSTFMLWMRGQPRVLQHSVLRAFSVHVHCLGCSSSSRLPAASAEVRQSCRPLWEPGAQQL